MAICRAASKIVGPKAAGSVVTLSFILLWWAPFQLGGIFVYNETIREYGMQEALVLSHVFV